MNVTVGAPSFNVGDEAVFFLTTRGRDLPAIFGLNQGVFRVSVEGAQPAPSRDAAADVARKRGLRPSSGATPARRPVPLETFGAQVQSVIAETGRTVR